MKTIIILLTLALCASAQARIGETVAECVKRYGNPDSVDATGLTFVFKANGLHIDITFNGGKCVVIEYSRWKPGFIFVDHYVENLDEVEQNFLLDVNAGGQKWIKNEGWYDYPIKTESGHLFANRNLDHKLKISTPEACVAELRKRRLDAEAQKVAKVKAEAARKAEAEKKLQGL